MDFTWEELTDEERVRSCRLGRGQGAGLAATRAYRPGVELLPAWGIDQPFFRHIGA